jgi:NitT/TauT family transport system substrate-binding protein
MNEALLSGNLDVANGGLTALIVLWDKSKGAYVGLSALSSMPAVLMTRDPAVRSVKDLKESDRVAVVSRVSMQAIILRMLAAEAYGKDQFAKLDHLTVPLPHPDAMAAMLSGRSEITAHFTSSKIRKPPVPSSPRSRKPLPSSRATPGARRKSI